MTLFKTAVASLLTLVSATNFKSSSTGYSGNADVSYDTGNSCPLYGNYVSVYAYSSQSKFKATPGKAGYVDTVSFDDLSVNFVTSSCDGSTVNYSYGSLFEYSGFGGQVSAKLMVESKKLLQASLTNVPVPVYGGSCNYECYEVCYPEIFGYGTCPETEPAFLECQTTVCSDEQFLGVANVDVNWKMPAGTNTNPAQSSSTYRFRDDKYSSISKSKGTYRFDIPTTVAVTLGGSNVFSSAVAAYSYGEIASTTSIDISKFKNVK